VTLHPRVVNELLEAEAESIRLDLADRIEGIHVDGVVVYVKPTAWGGKFLRLDGSEYDQKPFRVAVVGPDCQVLSVSDWPAQLNARTDHPIVQGPWSCIQGTYEYHTFPGHAAEGWDLIRTRKRMKDLVKHIITKAGG